MIQLEPMNKPIVACFGPEMIQLGQSNDTIK